MSHARKTTTTLDARNVSISPSAVVVPGSNIRSVDSIISTIVIVSVSSTRSRPECTKDRDSKRASRPSLEFHASRSSSTYPTNVSTPVVVRSCFSVSPAT